jgi:hypothetical protein
MIRVVVVLALAASVLRKRSSAEMIARLEPTWVREPSPRLVIEPLQAGPSMMRARHLAVVEPTWVREPSARLVIDSRRAGGVR